SAFIFSLICQLGLVPLPGFVLVTTAFLGAPPASSPVLCLKYGLSLSITSLPLIWTVLLPAVVSEAIPVLGYGSGTPGGVAGVCGGGKQTSGKEAMDFPAPDLQESSRPVAYTSLLMILPPPPIPERELRVPLHRSQSDKGPRAPERSPSEPRPGQARRHTGRPRPQWPQCSPPGASYRIAASACGWFGSGPASPL